MTILTSSYAYTFQKRDYIGLNVALSDILQLPIDNIIKRLLPALCFYYRGTVLYNETQQSFEGMVFPDMDTITVKHIQAAMAHSHDYAGKGTPLTSNAMRHMREQKDGYTSAFTSAGNASTNNGFIETQPIVSTDYDFIEIRRQQQPTPTFELLEMVLPHYLLPLDWLKNFATTHRYALNQYALEGISCLSAQKIHIERGDSLNEPFINITGDMLHHRIDVLSIRTEMLQEDLNDKETQLQEALATIQALQEKLDNHAATPNSPSKQQAREALLEKLLTHMEKAALEHDNHSFDRQKIRTTKDMIMKALQTQEKTETGKNVLFSISEDTFNDFWKLQRLCKSVGGKSSMDTALLPANL